MIPIGGSLSLTPLLVAFISSLLSGIAFSAFWLALYKRECRDSPTMQVFLLIYVISSAIWLPVVICATAITLGGPREPLGSVLAAAAPGVFGACLVVWATKSVLPAAAALGATIVFTTGAAFLPGEIAALAGPILWVGSVLLAAVHDPKRRLGRTPQWQCVACRYDLRGITATICPECGTERRT